MRRIMKASHRKGGRKTEQATSELLQKACRWIDSHWEEMIADLIRIVNIPSVSDKDSPVKPFGPGCHRVIDEFLKLGESYGFSTANYDGYFGEVRLGDQAADIGIWTHLDVVPVGNDWIYEPFQAVRRGNYIIGRGVQDNKGPAVGMLYVMRCLRSLGVPLRRSIRLFVGTNEEKGMADAAYYASHYRCPDLNLVPDSGFPVCYGERGAFDFRLTTREPMGKNFPVLTAGEVRTMIPGTAQADFSGCADASAFLQTLSAPQYTVEGQTLTAHGVSKHAMSPEGAVSPLLLLADALAAYPGLTERDRMVTAFLQEACRDFCGTAFGLACEDTESGPLICAATMLRREEDGRLSLEASCKFPVTFRWEDLLPRLQAVCDRRSFDLTVLRQENPNYYRKDSPVVQKLTALYNEITGLSTVPFIMSGGTYARKLPNAIAYGTGMPVDPLPEELFPKGHGDFHQPDESLDLKRQRLSMEIYTAALSELDRLPHF